MTSSVFFFRVLGPTRRPESDIREDTPAPTYNTAAPSPRSLRRRLCGRGGGLSRCSATKKLYLEVGLFVATTITSRSRAEMCLVRDSNSSNRKSLLSLQAGKEQGRHVCAKHSDPTSARSRKAAGQHGHSWNPKVFFKS